MKINGGFSLRLDTMINADILDKLADLAKERECIGMSRSAIVRWCINNAHSRMCGKRDSGDKHG